MLNGKRQLISIKSKAKLSPPPQSLPAKMAFFGPEFLCVALTFNCNTCGLPYTYSATNVLSPCGFWTERGLRLVFPLFPSTTSFNKAHFKHWSNNEWTMLPPFSSSVSFLSELTDSPNIWHSRVQLVNCFCGSLDLASPEKSNRHHLGRAGQ